MATSLNIKQSGRRKNQMADRSRERHQEYWPEVPEADLWVRQNQTGFITIPRTMPILMSIIDSLTKGKPAGMTYFTLWCRCPDFAAITIESPEMYAAESGFSGQRRVDQWKTRMKSLSKLGFIKSKPGATGEFHDVLLLNPHKVVRASKDLPESLWRQLFARGQQISAADITEPPKPTSPAPTVPKKKTYPASKKLLSGKTPKTV